jgi:hypothetical protein
VTWNRQVNNLFNNGYDYPPGNQQSAFFDKILCDSGILKPSHMMTGQGYQEVMGTNSQSWAAGYTTTNIAIMQAVNISGKDAFAAKATSKNFDSCLGAAEPASAMNSQGVVQSNMPGVWNYNTMSPCMINPPETIPELCSKTDCNTGVTKWMSRADGWPSTANHGGVIGLARDGHAIVGPYNSDGELWACDEHDFCNGAFLDDGSYAYVMTTTFPYVVGCWGPGTV